MFDSESIKQQITDKQMARKQSELEQIAQNAIVEYWRDIGFEGDPINLKTLSEEIISNFVRITPPEVDITMKMITLSEMGASRWKHYETRKPPS